MSDMINDIKDLRILYPDTPKEKVFQKSVVCPNTGGYVRTVFMVNMVTQRAEDTEHLQRKRPRFN